MPGGLRRAGHPLRRAAAICRLGRPLGRCANTSRLLLLCPFLEVLPFFLHVLAHRIKFLPVQPGP